MSGILVFEVGGSNMRAGVFDPRAGCLTETVRRPTPNYHTLPDFPAEAIMSAVLDAMAELGRRLIASPTHVAVGYPGPVAPDGRAHSSPTILGPGRDRPYDIGIGLRARFPGSDVLVMNDLTAAGWRYAAQLPDFCLVNLGSGVGNKIFVDGRPVVGPAGRGGELGHYVVDASPHALPCECGGQGHLAGIASGRGTLNHCRRAAADDAAGFAASALASTRFETADIAHAFRHGDAWTLARVRETLAPLARALAGIHVVAGIERFILIGGWALGLGPGLRDHLAELAAVSCWSLGQDWSAMLEMGHAGDDDGLIGAGLAAQAYMSA